VSAKAFTVFALFLFATSFKNDYLSTKNTLKVLETSFPPKAGSQNSEFTPFTQTNTAAVDCFSPFAFEYDVNPVI